MLDQFYAKNFKCFNQIEVKSCRRANLITGKNNVGKTSLLEAIFLHEGAHNAGLVFSVEKFRGITAFNNKDFVSDIFTKFKCNEEIILEAKYKDGKNLLVKIRQEESSQARPFDASLAELQGTSIVSPLVVFEGIENNEVKSKSQVFLGVDPKTGQLASFAKAHPTMLRPTVIFASTGLSKIEKNKVNVERFTAQIALKRKDKILNSLKLVDDNLRDVASGKSGPEDVIIGDIGYPKMMPVSLMGEGIEKYLYLVLSLLAAENGIVLIDEIENGFHYSIHSNIWRNLVLLAREYNVQIIATTHSREFIEAAHRSYSKDKEYDFILHRIDIAGERHEDVVYEKGTLEASLDENMEIR